LIDVLVLKIAPGNGIEDAELPFVKDGEDSAISSKIWAHDQMGLK
jgi:hypothetical protein